MQIDYTPKVQRSIKDIQKKRPRKRSLFCSNFRLLRSLFPAVAGRQPGMLCRNSIIIGVSTLLEREHLSRGGGDADSELPARNAFSIADAGGEPLRNIYFGRI